MSRAHDHDHDTGAPLVPFEDARRRMLDPIRPLAPRPIDVIDAAGCVLAETVHAPIDLPPFTSSAMDGFAVRAEDVAGAAPDSPVALRVVGRVEMGRGADGAVEAGCGIAVPTGGVVPAGADAIVPIERCVVERDRVLVLSAIEPGRFVRRAGEDARRGDVLVERGRRLGAPEAGLLASAGVSRVSAHPRARVAIVSTGDELVGPDHDLRPGQLHDANGATLRVAVIEAGAIPVSVEVVSDDSRALTESLESGAKRADLLVSSGGVSVGERDPVKNAFASSADVEFIDVAMQPGKPQAFGRLGGVPYFGLPGNPVSVFVSFEAFVRPALMRLMGRPESRPEILAILDADVSGPANKTMFARVRVRRDGHGWTASPTGPRQSNLLATVSRANALAIVPAGIGTLHAGAEVRAMLFRDLADP